MRGTSETQRRILRYPPAMQPFLDRDLRIRPIDVFIGPPQQQRRAIITHGHGDHARSGHGAVLATPDTVAIMKPATGRSRRGSSRRSTTARRSTSTVSP